MKRNAGELPLVSVVMPSYNAGKYIAEAIDSVLGQEYPLIELLVIDDGSTDDTLEILDGYGDRIKVIQQANSGAAVARNEGLRRAAGEYIAFLDSDDVWLPGKVDAQVAHLNTHRELGGVGGRWREWLVDAAGQYQRPEVLPEHFARAGETCTSESGWLYARLLLDCMLLTSTVMLRRAVVQQAGFFDPSLRRGQDYDYWLRISQIAPIDKLSGLVTLYRIEDLPRKFPEVNWEMRVLSKALDTWGTAGPDGQAPTPPQLQQRLWKLNFDFGYAHYRAGNFPRAVDAFAEASRHSGGHAKTRALKWVSIFRRWLANSPFALS